MSLADPNNPAQPLEFPAIWASEWGHDEIGLWMGFTYKTVNYRFRWILPGRFLMGSQDNQDTQPPHYVTITQGFWLGETTVTQALWLAVMGEDNPSEFKGKDLPVERVSWQDVQLFINRFHQEEPELKLCLPTEAQWEYACRAGTKSMYHFGEQLFPEQAHFSLDKVGDAKNTVGVYAKPANPWGLHQMHGNVLEWCQDRYAEDYYAHSPFKDPQGPEWDMDKENGAERKVLRGGSWFHRADRASSAYRDAFAPDDRNFNAGFRLARR